MKSLYLAIAACIFLAALANSATIGACGADLSGGGYFVLTTNITTTGTCLSITASNTVINLDGFAIIGDGSSVNDYAITADSGALSNFTFANGSITGFGRGLDLRDLTSVNVTNVSIWNHTQYGISIVRSSIIAIDNSSSLNNSNAGVYMDQGVNFTNITNSRFNNNNSSAVDMRNSNNNRFINVTANNDVTFAGVASGGFRVQTSHNDTFINNTAYNNSDYGFWVRNSSENNISHSFSYNNTIYDLYMDVANVTHCNNLINDMESNNGRYVNYSNTTVNWSGFNFSQLVLCAANNSVINNVTINGSDEIGNNGLHVILSGNVTVANSTSPNNYIGFELKVGATNNTLISNTAYNNTLYGIFVTSSRNNIIVNNTVFNNSITGILLSASTNSTVENNTAYNNTQYGIQAATSHWSNFTNNTAYRNTLSGFRSTSSNSTWANNTSYSNLQYGFELRTTSNTNSVYYNTLYNNSQGGIYMSSTVTGNLVHDNKIYNHTAGVASGIFINAINGLNHIYDNSVINNNTYGIYLNRTNLTNITGNSISLNLYAVYATVSLSNNLTSNNASNNTYGFYFNFSSGNFSNNTAFNNSLVQYQFNESSNSTFIDINYALLTGSGGFDLNSTSNSNVTTLYNSLYNNFTTTYLTIFLGNASNVAIKTMNLSDSGASDGTCTGFTGHNCNLITPSDNVVNVTNTSTGASVNLGIYYGSVPTGSIVIGRYNSTGWENLTYTNHNATLGSLSLDNVINFSTFGVIDITVAAQGSSISDGRTTQTNATNQTAGNETNGSTNQTDQTARGRSTDVNETAGRSTTGERERPEAYKLELPLVGTVAVDPFIGIAVLVIIAAIAVTTFKLSFKTHKKAR